MKYNAVDSRAMGEGIVQISMRLNVFFNVSVVINNNNDNCYFYSNIGRYDKLYIEVFYFQSLTIWILYANNIKQFKFKEL